MSMNASEDRDWDAMFESIVAPITQEDEAEAKWINWTALQLIAIAQRASECGKGAIDRADPYAVVILGTLMQGVEIARIAAVAEGEEANKKGDED